MKFLQVILTLSLLLLLVPLLVVESSSSSGNNNVVVSNITRGSSLSSNDTSPYWLSPSGNLAFGFYQLPCTHSSSTDCPDRYVVGIWFVKSSLKTLVWTAHPNKLPLHKPSSIRFTGDRKLMLRMMPDNKEKPLLPDLQEPVSYGMMHDHGNFVLYGSDSQIVWESFDYPTDTILGGQKLKDGIDLISGNYRLSARQADGLVAIYNTAKMSKVVSHMIEGPVSTPVTLNLDTTGNLQLIGGDDVVLEYLFRNKAQQQEEGRIATEEEEGHVYRATLDSGGIFSLYKERIDGNNEKNSLF